MIFKSPFKKSNIKNEILNFIKTYLTIGTYNDIKTILEPCCIPSITIAESFACTGNSYTVFSDVTVNTVYKSKDVTLIFTFTQPDKETYTSSLNVTLDSNGQWSGEVTMWSWVISGTVNVTVGVVLSGSQVISTSSPITVTGVPNCD